MAEASKQIKIELRDEEAEGTYANFAAITHSPAEFVIDFIRVLPGTKKSRVHARILMAPQNVKAFVRALEENIEKYEEVEEGLPGGASLLSGAARRRGKKRTSHWHDRGFGP